MPLVFSFVPIDCPSLCIRNTFDVRILCLTSINLIDRLNMPRNHSFIIVVTSGNNARPITFHTAHIPNPVPVGELGRMSSTNKFTLDSFFLVSSQGTYFILTIRSTVKLLLYARSYLYVKDRCSRTHHLPPQCAKS